ncbi:cell division protein FtsK [Streptomyces sp. PTM05]|uniref:Cell division protein FtsK n=1 Tax=Streptantibioticus parmotrematis TaxID=2873249 RepID=A0ABS7QYN7_9ACTN|nr:FtsK/SpoIIIE domain-containing protein [Streptantibioticus parmotrematis]MBY8886904.1 cell division protein FtsK [Streptantibioticus parmotrematis]
MVAHLIPVALLVLAGLAYLTRKRWAPRLARRGLDVRTVPWRWLLVGYPVTAVRMRVTWRQTALIAQLSISRRGNQRVLGGVAVSGTALRQSPPRLGVPRPTRDGLVVRVALHPGQTPRPFLQAAEALAHAWRVYSVRVTSPARGEVVMTVTAQDPLAGDDPSGKRREVPVLTAPVGRLEQGRPWIVSLLMVPHWLVVGTTRSGKSNWINALALALAPQPVALVGVDLKGGLELAPWAARLSALAVTRAETRSVLGALVDELADRMAVCRAAAVRDVWELPDADRPVPIVVLVDEIAELFLTDGSRASKEEATACATALLRIAQLGAALGVHLVVSGQRFGAELGPGATALRAQLAGRVAHRTADSQTAEMALGDLAPDAIDAAQSITTEEQGVAITTDGGVWMRARSTLVTTEAARQTATDTAGLRQELPRVTAVLAPALDLDKEGGA